MYSFIKDENHTDKPKGKSIKMSDKTSNKKRVGMYAAAVAVLTISGLAIGMTVSNNNEDNGSSANPVASATATASPSAEPTVTPGAYTDVIIDPDSDPNAPVAENGDQILAELKARPLGIDVDKVMAEGLASDVLTTFPEADFQTSEGILFTLQTFQELNSIEQFYGERAEGEDFSRVLLSADGLTADLISEMEKITAEKGKFSHVLTVPTSGMVDGHKTLAGSGIPWSDFGQPIVTVDSTGTKLNIESREFQKVALDGNKIPGDGRKYTLKLEGDKYYHGSMVWQIQIVHTEDGWKISNMARYGTGGVVSDSPVWKGMDD